MLHPALREELLELIGRDGALRERLAAEGTLFQGYPEEMGALHRANSARLRAIVEMIGWPGRSAVGDDGAAAAWRIAQHAIGEPALMRAWLALIWRAAREGEAEPAHAALLEDRIRTFEGRPQLYGTQYDWDETWRFMVPIGGIEDEADLEERRDAAGLPPMEWRRPPPPDEPPPAMTFDEREREIDGWARGVGWR